MHCEIQNKADTASLPLIEQMSQLELRQKNLYLGLLFSVLYNFPGLSSLY